MLSAAPAAAYVQPQLLGRWVYVDPYGYRTALQFVRLRGTGYGKLTITVRGLAQTTIEFRSRPQRDGWYLDTRPAGTKQWVGVRYVLDADELTIDPDSEFAITYQREGKPWA